MDASGPAAAGGCFGPAFHMAPVPAAVVGLDGRYRLVNEAFAELVGRSADELVGVSFADVTHADDVAFSAATLAGIRVGTLTQGRFEKRFVRPGSVEVCTTLFWTVVLGGGEPRVLCQAVDVTEQKRAEQALAHRAAYDPLTGAVTRPVFLDQLARALSRLPRVSGRHVVVLFCDLDRLKFVNDTYGHPVVDALIAAFAHRLRHPVRPSDVIGRIGGDEFAVLLEDIDHPAESAEIAHRVQAALSEPFVHAGLRLEIRASIGIAVSSTARATPEALLAHADSAMYRAKALGGGRVELFDEDAYAATQRRLRLEQQLREAVQRDELTLHYQPMLDIDRDRITAVEALLRWRHPDRGLVPAGEFVAAAEESGLLRLLTGWLFTTACAQLAGWDRQLGAVAPRDVFVNVAGSQLADEAFAATVTGALAAAGIAADRLHLEITETQIFADPAAIRRTVAELRAPGCELVVDDFGTGYSSLSRLTDLPIGALKLDRSFVGHLATSREAAAIAASVRLLAHNLRHTVIAEGVETPDELLAVGELGCHLAQGCLIAPPSTRPSPPGSSGTGHNGTAVIRQEKKTIMDERVSAPNGPRVPVSEARDGLTDLVNRAAYTGQVTVLTRRGRPLAAIVPLDLLPVSSQTPDPAATGSPVGEQWIAG